GRLLAISGKSVVRFKGGVGWAEGTCFVPDTEILISDSLVRPFDLAIGPNKQIYVTDGGTHQVKVFSPDGNKVRSIGKPGGSQLGRYDPERMHNPRGIAITRGGALWVAEYSTSPRRISVWRTDGRYEKAFYGGPQWDSQGSVDLVDRSISHYAEGDLGMQFRLDLGNGTADLETIYRRSGFLGRAPHVPIYVQGRKYMANRYDVHESGVDEPLGIWLWRDDRVIPVAAVGHTSQCKDFEPFSQVLGKNPKSLFIWSDLNGNGNAESEEFSFKKLEPCRLYIGSDLTIYTSDSYRLHPGQYTAGGVPVYDADEAQRVTSVCDGFAGFGQGVTFPGADGSVIVTGAPIRGYKSGKQLWWYPNQWVGANLAKKVPHTSRRGQLNAAVRLLGQPFYPHSLKKMGVWGIASYNGPCYLFTTDGLFIGELLGDGREEDITSPGCRQGDSIKNMSMGVDTPAISLTHTADDQTYLVAGKSHHSIARITNLASIRRIKPFAIELVPSDLAKVLEYFKNTGAEQAEPYLMSGFKVTDNVREKLAQYRILYESERIKRKGRLSLQVSALDRAPILDGRFGGWRKADWVHIDKHTRAAVGFFESRLYVALQTKHDKLLMNNAEDPKQIFACGGALELLVGSNPDADPARQKPVAGDKRLVVTRIDGKVCAVLYQPVSPDEKKPHTFKSRDSKIHFDLVKECTVDITIGQRPRHYEMSVPLKLLGIKPKNGLVLRGDLGIIKGREGSCVWRKCWNNQATSCGVGLKYEVKMYPQFWGEWHFPKGD
ncbi:MAG: hypothetical protein KGZ25_15290, partial [Planctomycetes bacterium]|nr:hypothetical protein [Planctomycetota bacterium]